MEHVMRRMKDQQRPQKSQGNPGRNVSWDFNSFYTMVSDNSRPKTLHQQLKRIVIKHRHLIRLFQNLQSAYSACLLQELFGITLLTCIGWYNLLAASALMDSSNFLRFLIYILTLTTQLFGLCYIGECLMTESTNIYNAFCNCEWYDVPPYRAKFFLMCLLRLQKPFALTAGKFFTFSLENFTIVMKTSMAYLSVLRNFI